VEEKGVAGSLEVLIRVFP